MTNKINYCNGKIRRQDRLSEEADALELLHMGEYGILSMVETDNEKTGGYGIPLNYVWDGDNALYFHCAADGQKLNCLKENPNVSFCVVGHTNVISHKFTTAYESIVIRGSINAELSLDERKKALTLILDKYSPDDKELGINYIEKSFSRTAVLRLDIKEISGKANQMMP